MCFAFRSTLAAQWQAVPLATPAQRVKHVGGEGGQWPRGPVVVSPTEPDFLLLPIDVGGLYRSLDGGTSWHVAMVGWNARGANGFAIDPKNASHVIGIGANSMDWDPHWGQSPNGLYVSTDKAASWRQVLQSPEGFGGSVAFDPTSSSENKNGTCPTAYYLSHAHGMFRTSDGGISWSRVAVAPDPGAHDAGSWDQGVDVRPTLAVDSHGVVFTAGEHGLFASRDCGETWSRLRAGSVTSMCLDAHDTVYLASRGQLLASTDAGKTFAQRAPKNLAVDDQHRIQGLCASNADPKRLLCYTTGPGFDWKRYVSDDAGETWSVVPREPDGALLPMNCRQGFATWSPKDPLVAYNLGGDWVIRSTDGGKTFRWSSNGYVGVMVGGLFNFSPHAGTTLFLGFQDYNGAFTTDAGETWNYRDVSGKGWGGHEYGAFALNEKTMWAGDADGWGSPRKLRISRDGGKTFAFAKIADGKEIDLAKGSDVSFADPTDANVGFCDDYRTPDGGATWTKMQNCDGVYASSDGVLYGRHGAAVVTSTDAGVTWKFRCDVEGAVRDIAVASGGRIFVASGNRLKQIGKTIQTLDTPADQFGNVNVWSVATDPADANILYIAGPANTYSSSATICRSTDAGQTWTNLTPQKPGEVGPHEVTCVRINPKTREAWAAGECFGLWKIAPPAASEKGVPAKEASSSRPAPAADLPE